jgi:chromosome segregation ATPase
LLAATSNRVVATEVEMGSLRTQMTTRIAELEQSVTSAGADKSKAEARAQELRDRLTVVEKDLADEKVKLASNEEERARVAAKLTSVTGELGQVKGQLADLQKTHAATEAELLALQAKKDALELERASLERRLNDLDELKAQIRLVKHRLWEQHVADWKRRDMERGLGGNGGVLLKNGQWVQ